MKIKNLKLKIILISTLYILHFTFTCSVIAVESTPSANVKQKLHALQQEIASKAARLKTEIQKKLQNKAYVGVVKSKSVTTLTLAARSGTKIVNINQDTVYEPNKKFKEEDRVAALGDVDETEVLTAKKIVISPHNPYTLNPTTYLWGQVISISDHIITVQTKALKSVAVSLTKVDTPVKTGQSVIITGSPGKNDILSAQFVYVIPEKETSKKIVNPAPNSAGATPSAKVASPSGKKK